MQCGYRNSPTISKIEDGLYMGDLAGAKDIPTLKKLGVTLVIIFMSDNDYKKDDDIEYHHVNISDSWDTNIMKLFDPVYDLIKFYRDSGDTVYVHCLLGVSRSASFIIAYLMKDRNWTYRRAHRYVLKKRQCVHPNFGFVCQLREYEKELNSMNIIDPLPLKRRIE